MSGPSQKFTAAALCAVLGAALALLALGFAAFAAFLALSTLWPAWQAALAVAGAALILAALLLWIASRKAETAAHETEAAIKSHLLVRAAPIALKFALGRPRLVASVAAALAALTAVLRAFEPDKKA